MGKPSKEQLVIPQPLLIVGAAAEVGLLQALENSSSLTVDEAAKQINADLRAMGVILKALLDLGYVQEEQGEYSLSNEARAMLYDEKSPQYTGYAFMHAYQLTQNWIKLPEVIRSGKPVPRSAAHIPHFMRAMESYAKTIAPQIVPVIMEDITQPINVLDIGGGPGIYAREFAKLGAEVTILDQKPVVEMMQPKVDTPQIRYIEGDFTVGLPEGNYNLAFLGNITHILDGEGNVKLFKKVYEALQPKGRIAILDIIQDMSPRGVLFAVNMLVNTDKGGTWKKAEYLDWLAESGFKNSRIVDLKDRQIILAEK